MLLAGLTRTKPTRAADFCLVIADNFEDFYVSTVFVCKRLYGLKRYQIAKDCHLSGQEQACSKFTVDTLGLVDLDCQLEVRLMVNSFSCGNPI